MCLPQIKTLKTVVENTILLSLITVLLIIPTALSIVYKTLIYVYLKFKHGKSFYRMMDGDETIFATQDKSYGQIITMFVHSYNKQENGDVLNAFQKKLDYSEDLKETCPKLFCRRGYCLGYYYFYTDFNQKLTKEMRSYDSVDDLRRLLCDYGSSCEPLGDNDDGMMQLLIGTKPIDWNGYQGLTPTSEEMYPVIVRTHHSLGDGVSLNSLFITSLIKNPREFLADTYEEMLGTRKHTKTIKADASRLNKYFKLLWALLRKERYAPPILRRYDRHVLHGRRLCGRKNLVWNRDAHSDYVRKVKDVKNHHQGASFNSVILAAIATTFNEYFQKNSPSTIPPVITTSLVTLPKIPKFNEMVQLNSAGNISNIDMTNKYVICALKLPMTQDHSCLHAADKIGLINEEIGHLKRSLDIEVLLLCNRIIAKLLPAPCVKLLMRGFNTTFGISNLPGFARGQLWHGGRIQDLYFWIPNSIDVGIGISIFSSSGRLEMGLIMDEIIIADVNDCQSFLDRIMFHIDEMWRSIKV